MDNTLDEMPPHSKGENCVVCLYPFKSMMSAILVSNLSVDECPEHWLFYSTTIA